MKKSVLVVGGAGRFGSQLADRLAKKSLQVVTFDSLVTSDSSRVMFGPLVKADVRESSRLARALKEYSIELIFHCGFLTETSDLLTEKENEVGGLLSVIASMREGGAHRLVVFSPRDEATADLQRILSDCAVAYGIEGRVMNPSTSEQALSELLSNLLPH